jgi:Na+/H+-dicarboxylate symporter
MKNSLILLVALLLALGLGIIASVTQNAALLSLAKWIEPIGVIWIGFLKMTMLPLVIALLITSVSSTRQINNAPLLKRTLLVFLTLYVIALIAAMVLMPLMMQLLPASATVPENIVDTTAISSEKPLSFLEQVVNWVPVNPFKSAAEGAILPLVIFSLMFGLAVNHISEEPKRAVTLFFQGVTEVMLKIVEWVLLIVPLGIFCVVFPLASQMGVNLVGALGFYVAASIVVSVVCLLIVCVIASFYTETPFLRFMSACLQPQFVALGTQSSLATLPTMVEVSEEKLQIPSRVTNMVLPLAVAIFKVGSAGAGVTYIFFAARMYHVELTFPQILITFIVALVTAVGGAGLPSGASFFAPIVTIFMAVGLPVEIIPILFAVDTIPDMGQTVTNVTADMAAASMVAKNTENVTQG